MDRRQKQPWVERSDTYARRLIEADARFAPENYGQWGYEGADEDVTQLSPDVVEQKTEALGGVLDELTDLAAEETDPDVRFDLEILAETAREEIETLRLESARLLPFPDVAKTVFSGLRALLDGDRKVRTDAALKRLERYRLLPRQAESLIRSRLDDPDLQGPYVDAVQARLATSGRYVTAIESLFETSTVRGYKKPLAALRAALDEHFSFVRAVVLPRARRNFRLPPELYTAYSRRLGVELPPDELARWARVDFGRTQSELRELARKLSGERDYRHVVRDLKKDQLTGDEVLACYDQRIRDLRWRVEHESLLTLPDLEIRVRLAGDAETVVNPAPHVRIPWLLGRTGGPIELVLPLRTPGVDGSELVVDDVTCRAAVDSLVVHEVLGHGVQFAVVHEKGVSLARRFCAASYANIEGWASYVEDEISPGLPLAARILALRRRLLRAGRAFLEAELQLGVTELAEASRILREDVVLSAASVEQELQRYTFRSPGQAGTYFCGSALLLELRSQARQVLGSRFVSAEFHDFLLSQGFLFFGPLRRRLLLDQSPA